VLAVDADSNANLNELLGGVRERARDQVAALKGVSKQEFLDLRVQEALVEQTGYDLLVMGRPEGQGCYCYANNVLREVLQKLTVNYKHIVLDSEAGLEHISRRTLLKLDALLIVSDCSVRGVRTAGRVSALADEVALPARRRGLILNRIPDAAMPDGVRAEAEKTGLALLAAIPLDASVAAMDGGGASISAIPAGAPVRRAVDSLMRERLLTNEERVRMSTNQVFRDPATNEMVQIAIDGKHSTVWDRYKSQHPQCKFALDGVCCRLCHMGPCRITPKAKLGICGADADTITARNLLREIAAGTAAHSDHGPMLVRTLKHVSTGKGGEYKISDPIRPREAARFYELPTAGLDDLAIAGALADFFMQQFAWSEEPNATLTLAPEKRQALWKKLGIEPHGVDSAVVELMHRTHMGVDHDYRHLILGGLQCSLADGWVGSAIATTVSDILFGTPKPVRSKVNLGVLSADQVNIIVHGHEPTLSEMLALASQDPELLAYAKSKGAAGINIAGICCTANEVLMRHGLPIAGNFLQQELAILTGAVELMIIDVQCVMPSLSQVVKCFHTKLVSTSEIAETTNAEQITFEVAHGYAHAARLIRNAIDNFERRDPLRVHIPKESMELVAGFSNETIFHMLGGRFRSTFRPLNDAIIDGRIRGVVGIVGCSNPKVMSDSAHVRLAEELIKRNVLVLETGCAAIACAKAGLLVPEAAIAKAGDTLREVCEAVGIPPVLHMGSCVDNSRILMAATNVLLEGGLGEDLSDLPVAGAAPEWMSEKAVAIGHYFVASGMYVVLGHPLYVEGSENVTRLLCEEMEGITGGRFEWEPDPVLAADKLLSHIEKKRDALRINVKKERKLFDMKERRELV
jgi:carbon-monoxide dehydrogenase catalytic subunit